MCRSQFAKKDFLLGLEVSKQKINRDRDQFSTKVSTFRLSIVSQLLSLSFAPTVNTFCNRTVEPVDYFLTVN